MQQKRTLQKALYHIQWLNIHIPHSVTISFDIMLFVSAISIHFHEK